MTKIKTKNILEILNEYFVDYATELIPNNLPSVCDGLLPVHRKIIFSLWEFGSTHDKPFRKMLINSAEVMKYYVFGDGPLTQSMKNAGSNFVLYEYLDPKGQYPDKNRRDGVGSSPRYIECRLTDYSEYLLQGIKYKNVPFVSNWDESRTEPTCLPSPVPNMLINNSESISVGFSSKIPSHNLNEVCDAFINYIKTKDIEASIDMIKGVDSPLGASLIYDKEEHHKIMTTGRGSYQMVSKWDYDKKQNKITITEIPQSTVIEEIDEKIRKGIEDGKFKEISDVQDLHGYGGLRYEIYLKKNTDVEKVISKLRRYTTFQKSVPIYLYMIRPDGITPHLYNLEELIIDWTDHRIKCIRKELEAEVIEIQERQNRMDGLFKISTDLESTHKIIRESKNEKEVIKNLSKKFDLNDYQAEYISTIRMVSLNKEWIAKQTKDYETLTKKVKQNQKIISDDEKIKNIIIKQLEEAKEKYGRPRKTEVIYDMDKTVKVDIVDDYNCTIVGTEQGYIKKIMRYSDNQKTKDGDTIIMTQQTTNKADLLVFTNKANMYTVKISSLEESVPSSLGQYLPSMINFEPDEEVICYVTTSDYSGNVLICFENGKVARIQLSAYKNNLKKTTKAYNSNSKVVGIFLENDNQYIRIDSNNNKRVIYDIKQIRVQASRNSQGIQVMKLKTSDFVKDVKYIPESNENIETYLIKSAGAGKTIRG